ncbi:MAG: CHAT domain-containing protein, partial [Planctomycetales bacterium]|nr:CHAT domain-containing protein [Planctomycetales bacterium]
MAAIQGHLANCLRLLGRHAEAESAATSSLQQTTKAYGAQHPQTARALWNVAHTQAAAGHERVAVKHLDELINLQNHFDSQHEQPLSLNARQLKLECQRRLGEVSDGSEYRLLLRRRWQNAREHARAANAHVNAAEAVALAEYVAFLCEFADNTTSAATASPEDVEALLEQAIALNRTAFGSQDDRMLGLMQLRGERLFLAGSVSESVAVLTEIADAIEQTRLPRGQRGLHPASRGRLSRTLPLLAIALARTGDATAAWQRLEQGRARGLWDELAARHAADTHASTNSQAPTSLGVATTYDLPAVQRQIPADTMLVSWIGVYWAQAKRGEFWACAVRRTGEPRWFPLRGTTTSEPLSTDELHVSRQLLSELSRPDGQRDLQLIAKLSDQVRAQRLDPIQPACLATGELPAVNNLVVVMPGPCHAPLEVLTDAYTISYVPSATIFAWLRESWQQSGSAEGSRLLAIGAPNVSASSVASPEFAARADSQSPPSLPGTERELASIAALFGQRATTILGDNATTYALQDLADADELRKYRYLHFAMHGEANHTIPLQSALLLASPTQPASGSGGTRSLTSQNGRLTAQQILDSWRLDSQLVTLSACETALGPSI